MEIVDILSTSFIDYPKLISCIIFTQGCNMTCEYCHNKEFMNNEKLKDEKVILDFLNYRKNVLDGLVISGGEPTLQEDLFDFCYKVKDLTNLKIKLDTNGTNPNILNKLIDNKLIDYIAMDIKAPKEKYKLISGIEYDDHIIESIEIVKSFVGEFRTTVFPKLTEEDIIKIYEIAKPKQLFLQQYVPTKYCNLKPYEDKFIKDIANRLNCQTRGLK